MALDLNKHCKIYLNMKVTKLIRDVKISGMKVTNEILTVLFL